ncbi:MAG: hypothetical protein WCD70_06455 [Alphaproteobacteria bacterium]
MRILSILVWVFLLGCGAARAADALPATVYFPVLPFDAGDNALPQMIPLAANHPLDGVQAGLTRAIIVIHDDTRDANGALSMMTSLAGQSNGSTMIIAPQFLLASDIARYADHLPDEGSAFAAWQMNGWMSGDDSVGSAGHKGVSSFTIVDLLLMYLSDRTVFPDLRVIVIAGSGAGANFVQRYAAFGIAADLVEQQNIALRYVLADASSYLYMTPNRPMAGKQGFGSVDAAACPGFNSYPYGTDGLNSYARRIGANAAKTNYAVHFVTYLNVPVADAVPESNCASLLQGADSAMRAVNYDLYLQAIYSDVAAKTQKFSLVKNVRNDAVGLFGSACGMAALFGDGTCKDSP